MSNPLRLFEKPIHVPAAGETVILPRVRRLRPFPLGPGRTLRSPGVIPAGAGLALSLQIPFFAMLPLVIADLVCLGLAFRSIPR